MKKGSIRLDVNFALGRPFLCQTLAVHRNRALHNPAGRGGCWRRCGVQLYQINWVGRTVQHFTLWGSADDCSPGLRSRQNLQVGTSPYEVRMTPFHAMRIVMKRCGIGALENVFNTPYNYWRRNRQFCVLQIVSSRSNTCFSSKQWSKFQDHQSPYGVDWWCLYFRLGTIPNK